ncbi:MAG: carboxylesterase/lipase family protein [Oscillospiraceae bacterium]|nr:carboxylesterase/lipase family protein [Oscillospiraceae bacterium]
MTIIREDYPLVQTTEGVLRGIDMEDVIVFRGVQYAEAERFARPRRHRGWNGVREAYVWGHVCPTRGVSESTLYTTNRIWTQGEDCLNLNIATSGLEKERKKPVMVWLHGGGFSGGSAIGELTTDIENLARTGEVVAVSVNHRLGCLGFLDLRDCGEEFAECANLGMLDIVEALRWIRDNIASFGGDPGNVTLFGQSGGGGKIMALMQMPMADGLYHKAIIQSGVMPVQDSWREPLSRQYGKLVKEKLSGAGAEHSSLRRLPVAALFRASDEAREELGRRMDFFGPHPDGAEMLDDFRTAGFREEMLHIPVLIGSCLGELAMFDPGGLKEAPFSSRDLQNLGRAEKIARLKERFHEDAEQIALEMENSYPELDVLFSLNVDSILRDTILGYARARARKASAPVYNYLFSYCIPVLEGKLPWHGSDLAFCFGNLDRSEVLRSGGEAAERVMRAMRDAWIAFAKTGNPTAQGLPEWKPFTAEEENCMLFTDPCRFASGHDRRLQQLLKKHSVSIFG